jgi:hypothetical protein
MTINHTINYTVYGQLSNNFIPWYYAGRFVNSAIKETRNADNRKLEYQTVQGKELNFSNLAQTNTSYNYMENAISTFYVNGKANLGVHIFGEKEKNGISVSDITALNVNYNLYTAGNTFQDGTSCFGDTATCFDGTGTLTMNTVSGADINVQNGYIQSCATSCGGLLSSDGQISAQNNILVKNTPSVTYLTSVNLQMPYSYAIDNLEEKGVYCMANSGADNFNCTYATGFEQSKFVYSNGRNKFVIEHVTNETVNYHFISNSTITRSFMSKGNETVYNRAEGTKANCGLSGGGWVCTLI